MFRNKLKYQNNLKVTGKKNKRTYSDLKHGNTLSPQTIMKAMTQTNKIF